MEDLSSAPELSAFHDRRLTVSGGWVLRHDPQMPSPFLGCDMTTGTRQSFNAQAFLTLGMLYSEALTPSELSRRLVRLGVTIPDAKLDDFIRDGVASRLLQEEDLPAVRTIRSAGQPIRSDVPVAAAPFDAEIHLTAGCNLRCGHCYIDATRPRPKELDPERWVRIADELENLAVFQVVVSGGEPLSSPRAVSVLRHLASKRYRVSLLTNGILISEDLADVVAAPNVTLSVSLDGADAATHDALRGRGTFARLMKVFALLRETGAAWMASVVITRQNLHQLEAIVDLARQYGARGTGIARIDLIGRAVQNAELALDVEQSKDVASRVQAMRAAAGPGFPLMLLDLSDPDNSALLADAPERREYSSCAAGTTHLAIRSDGEVFPCALSFDMPSTRVGRLSEGSLDELWRNGEWALFRGGIRTSELTECAACAIVDTCVVKNCRMRSLRYRGNVYAAACRTTDARA